MTASKDVRIPRRWCSRALTIAGAVAALGAFADDAQAARVHENIQAERLYYVWVHVPAYSTYTWETTALSSGADTVMHLWDWSTTSEIGYDDDGGAGLASKLSYTNWTASQKNVVLVVRAYSSNTQGSAQLLENGGLKAYIPVGGERITVQNGSGYVHETAKAPGGAEYPWLLALDSSRHLLNMDYVGGVAYQARVAHEDTYYVVVGTTSGSGPVNLYSNDPTDYDNDGLGYYLELELGTCDWASWSHCTEIDNLQDTDRDGLSDAAEIFGIDGSPAQHLPAWGADPLHKDVFVELDWNDAFAGQPFTESDAVAAAAIYDDGSAADLVNPDGLPGVRLHIDAGVTAANSANQTLIGDWGGSNAVPDGTSYKDAPDSYRAAIRDGVFRYGLINQGSGGGQASGVPGDRFNWGAKVNNRYVTTFAHELGHSLGIHHYGHESWGSANGKANYLSLMNYAYGGDEFSQGESNITLNPALVDEQAGIGADATHVGQWPFYRSIGANEEIDWDFDGAFNGSGWDASRAPVTFASSSSTNAFTKNERDLHNESDLPATTPALIRGPGDRLYAFYVDDDRIYYRHALQNGESWFGSCPGGDDIGDDCTTWSAAVQVPTSANARGLTVYFEGAQMLIAFRTQWDSLRTIRSSGYDGAGNLTGWGLETFHGVHTDKEPEVELLRVDPSLFGGYSDVVALFYRDKSSGEYRWRTMTSPGASSSTSRGDMLTDAGTSLYGTQSPTFTNWPYDPASSADGRACGAITDTNGEVGFYCYDRATNRFEDLSSTAFANKPATSGKPGLAFHAYRSWAGLPLDGKPERGAFWLSVVVADDKWDYPNVWISEPVSEAVGEDIEGVYFPVQQRGKFGNVWSNMVDGAGLALYDDPDLGAMKALWLRQDGADTSDPLGDVKLRFLPFADGGFRSELEDGNDFQIMERGICRGLASASYCGPSSFGLD